MEEEQKRIKEVLKHFEIEVSDLEGHPFTEIKNNKNTQKAFGIERIMMGRKERKVRITLDYDADYPVMILRVFPDGN